jgi:hypothetical protein
MTQDAMGDDPGAMDYDVEKVRDASTQGSSTHQIPTRIRRIWLVLIPAADLPPPRILH